MALYKILLYPLSVLYDAVTRFRNHLYNIRYKPEMHFETMVISVGNLAVGGTGKTPMVEYLIRLLKERYNLATLSRGYGRKSKGFLMVREGDTAEKVGDEPLQFFKKFGTEIVVTVGEERAMAIPEILFHHEEVEVILLDDAYQHRSVDRDLNILLTAYDTPFFEDYVLPAGRLRETRKEAERADLVVVTKCPENFSEKESIRFKSDIQRYTAPETLVFFSAIKYEAPVPVYGQEKEASGKALLVSGLASAKLFEDYARQRFTIAQHLAFGDHHHYTFKDILQLKAAFEALKGPDKFILTTEKDMVKFLNPEFSAVMSNFPFYYVPIQPRILWEEKAFQEMILNSIRKRKDSLKGNP